jgi:hypothetical protein
VLTFQVFERFITASAPRYSDTIEIFLSIKSD